MKIIYFLLGCYAFQPLLACAFTDIPQNCSALSVISDKNEVEITHSILSNNLRKRTGNPIEAQGAAIRIEGRLVDSACVPIMNSKITLWQKNSENIAQSPFGYDDDAPDTKADPYFAGNGTAYSDNEGRFVFFSVRPKVKGAEEPFAQIMVSHKDFSPFTGIFTFPDLLSLKAASPYGPQKIEIDKTTNETVYSFLIILEGKDSYRHY